MGFGHGTSTPRLPSRTRPGWTPLLRSPPPTPSYGSHSRRPTRSAEPPMLQRLLAPPSAISMPFVRRTAAAAAILVVVIFAAARLLEIYPWNEKIFDLWAYWSTRSSFDYAAAHPGDSGAYLDSPPFGHLIAPLTALPFPAFAAVWTALLVAALGWLTGWRAFFIGVLAPVTMSIAIG